MIIKAFRVIALLFCVFFVPTVFSQSIPLPEHPRPDFQREQWHNLNGTWEFKFDKSNQGVYEEWYKGTTDFESEILVPFPWGSKLSGVDDEADIAWYKRRISVDTSWKEKRVFVTIGASDWLTDVWIDGQHLGTHQGGYVPFSFEITEYVKWGKDQSLVIRVDDERREFTLYGKQGYGNARGIWQTAYLETRGTNYFDALHFTPDIDKEQVMVTAYLAEEIKAGDSLGLVIQTPGDKISLKVPTPLNSKKFSTVVKIPDTRLWTLDDPYLYEVAASLGDETLHSYFGMRKISVVDLPGTNYPYVALNNEPIYMELTLDQSYHPEGFYTFPDDQFIRDEIMRSKSIGLNGIRTHIKVEVPRKLFWADKLGLLVMADLPNSWGEPGAEMQAESEYTLREMIKRDYNHPSIFSWIVFNETWGLFSETGKDEHGNTQRAYLPETQYWVASMYYLAKSLDQTRLVEDNSICCGRGHTETDINSWHEYLPGWEWDERLEQEVLQTFEGSAYHFEEGFKQGQQPNMNSECGNVWGYDGSTGDVDWSWDYHRMLNSFRMYPEISGWLYTEHHDVINEWNGYWRFDRSEKFTGMEEICNGMDLKDLHSDLYLSTGNDICLTVEGGEVAKVPLFLSVYSGKEMGNELIISWTLETTNNIGETSITLTGERKVEYSPWMQKELAPLDIKLPDERGLAVLKLMVKDDNGEVLQKNFMHFEILSGKQPEKTTILSLKPADFSDQEWSKKQWAVLDGKKVNGAGSGFFRYHLTIPEGLKTLKLKEAYLLLELSAKELFVKDMENYKDDQDFMLGSRVAASANPNSYPMTDEYTSPSEILVKVNGVEKLSALLPDDPADHRGVLSWHHQLQDRKLREAGSYGYLVKVPLSKRDIKKAMEAGFLDFTLETKGEGGIAVYGAEFGRYPLDPSLVLKVK